MGKFCPKCFHFGAHNKLSRKNYLTICPKIKETRLFNDYITTKNHKSILTLNLPDGYNMPQVIN